MRSDLNACPSCGQLAGDRMMRDAIPEEHWIKCRKRGYATKRCKSLSAATKEWNRGKKVPGLR